MFPRFRSFYLAVFFVLNGFVAAFAAECDALFSVQNLEARINLAHQAPPGGASGQHLDSLLARLFTETANLQPRIYRDSDLALAISVYQAEIAGLSRITANRSTDVAQILAGNRHLASLRRMIILARDACNGATTSQLDLGSERKQVRQPDWGTTSAIGLALFAAACSAAYYISKAMRKNERRKKRFYCKVPVDITLGKTTFSSTMLDISGFGAKIKKTEAGELNGRFQLQFDKVQLGASIQWQNAHFFGVLFDKSLPRAQLYSLIETKRIPPSIRKAVTSSANKRKKGGAITAPPP